MLPALFKILDIPGTFPRKTRERGRPGTTENEGAGNLWLDASECRFLLVAIC